MLGRVGYLQRWLDRTGRRPHWRLRAGLLVAGACLLAVTYLSDSGVAYAAAMACFFLVIGSDLVALGRGTDHS